MSDQGRRDGASAQLTSALKGEDFRAAAIAGLAKHGEAGLPLLLRALRDESRKVRLAAATTASVIGVPAASVVQNLIPLLRDDHPEIVSATAKTLGKLGGAAERAVPALTEALRSKHAVVRKSAAAALGEMGAAGVPALALAVHDADAGVRYLAAKSLGRLGTAASAAADDVRGVLRDESPAVRRWAAWALDRMQGIVEPGTADVPA